MVKHENQYTEKDLIVANLLSRADQISKLILSAFKTDASHSDNAAKLASLRPDITCFETCADFLNIPLTKPDKTTALFSNKATIANRIVFAIEGLFPGKCEDCNEIYSPPFDPPEPKEKKDSDEDTTGEEKEDDDKEVKDKKTAPEDKEEDTPIVLHCFTCFRVSHADCVATKEQLKALSLLDGLPQGIVWLCHACRESKNPVKPPKKLRTCSVTHSVTNSGTVTPAEPAAPDGKINHKELTSALNDLAEQKEKEEDANDPKEDEERRKDNLPDNKSEQIKPKPKVCPKYKLRQCPHGRSGTIRVDGRKCPDPHPTRCRRYCAEGDNPDYGCAKKPGECKYWHPTLCYYSLKRGHCSNKDCTFTHLRGTARGRNPRPKEEDRRPTTYQEEIRRDARPRFPLRSSAPSRDVSRGDRTRRPAPNTQRPRRDTEVNPEEQKKKTEVKPKEIITPENAITTTSEPFLALMRLVTSLQEEHRQEKEERRFELSSIKTALHNMSLVSQQNNSFPQMLLNHAPEMIKMSQQYTGVPPPPMNCNNFPTLQNYQPSSY